LALRDLLRKLGFGSGGDDRQTGVRRGRIQQRPPDVATLRVDVNPRRFEPSAAGSAPPIAPEAIVRPKPAPPAGTAPAARPARTQVIRPMAGVGPDVGGATQYFSVPSASDVVGVLVATAGPLKGQAFTVRGDETRIGREQCDITLPDPSKRISRFHAKIVHREGAFVIEANPEVSKRNPTVVNGQEIEAEALCDADVIRLGDCTFTFRTI
jgi:FHA domain